ncbi:MAG: ATP-binding protein [Reichenbachiella sp.]
MFKTVKENIDKYAQFFEMASDAVFIADFKTLKIIEANTSAVNLLGYTKNELLKMTLPDTRPYTTSDDIKNQLDLARNVGSMVKESKAEKKDKTILDIEWSGKIIELAGTKLVYVSVRDITERKISERIKILQNDVLKGITKEGDIYDVLEYTCRGFEDVYSEMICSVLLYDPEKKVLLKGAGPSLPEFYMDAVHGFPIGEGNGSCGTAIFRKENVIVEDIAKSKLWDSVRDLINRTDYQSCWSIPIMSTHFEVVGTFAVYHRTPKIPKEADLKNITNFTYVIGLIIEKHLHQESIKVGEKQANQLNGFLIKQNKQLEEFTRIASHNLRAPIANIKSLIELRDSIDDDDFLWESLKKVSKNLSETINELTEIVKTSWELENEKQTISISNVCQHVLENVSNLIETSHAVIKTDFSAFDEIEYPKVYFESILQNFITNAFKYQSKERQLELSIESKIEGGRKVLEIGDNGIGIDLDVFGDKIFGLKNTFHGNDDARGLGLYITKTQVESLGGEVYVRSTPNQGAIFGVKF